MTTYTVEAHITKIVTMNVSAPTSKEALSQAEKYLQNGNYEKVGEESRLVAIS